MATCPVCLLQALLRASVAGRATGPVFVTLRKNNQLTSRRLTPEHINRIARHYLGSGYTVYSLWASFVIVTKLHGADNSEVMNQTKHKTNSMIRCYTRLDNARQYNAGKKLGL